MTQKRPTNQTNSEKEQSIKLGFTTSGTSELTAQMPAAVATTSTEIDAVIFDLDGTLLDSEPISEECLRLTLQHHHGLELPQALRSKLPGRPGIEASALVISELHLDHLTTAQEFVSHWERAVEARIPTLQFTKGAEELVHLFGTKLQVPIAIATSTKTEMMEFKRRIKPEFFDQFQVIVCGDDNQVTRGKPAPDIYLTAAKRLGIQDYSKVLVFEDAISGIRAGKAAGMQVVGIRDERLYSNEEDVALFQREADHVVTSLTQFDVSKWKINAKRC